MKVAGGLVGITLNENARVRFFLTAMKILEAIPPKERSNRAASQHQQNLSDMKVATVDGIVEV